MTWRPRPKIQQMVQGVKSTEMTSNVTYGGIMFFWHLKCVGVEDLMDQIVPTI